MKQFFLVFAILFVVGSSVQAQTTVTITNNSGCDITLDVEAFQGAPNCTVTPGGVLYTGQLIPSAGGTLIVQDLSVLTGTFDIRNIDVGGIPSAMPDFDATGNCAAPGATANMGCNAGGPVTVTLGGTGANLTVDFN